MSLDTTVRATSPVDWRMMFLVARQAVGIPDEWPFEIVTVRDEWDPFAISEPGGFGAAVGVYGGSFDPANGPTYTCSACFVSSPCGPTSEQDHARYVEHLGAWLTAQGVSYAVCDYRGEWQSFPQVVAA